MSVIETLWKILERLPVVEVLRDRDIRRYEHDRAKFKELESILSEEALDTYLEDIDQLSLRHSALMPVGEYLTWQRRERNQFLVRSVQKTHRAFAEALQHLKSTAGACFFSSEMDGLYAFRPQRPAEPSHDTSGRDYFDEGRREMHRLVKEVDDAFAAFRRVVKKNLQIYAKRTRRDV